MTTQLTSHFTLEEFLVSESAARLGIDNTPSEEVMTNLTHLAVELEKVRERIGRPIVITSGYRCPELNRTIGGSSNSAHMKGLAADFIIPPLTPIEICRYISQSSIPYDQLIYEHTWVHFGLSLSKPRTQQLTYNPKNGQYIAGFVEVV